MSTSKHNHFIDTIDEVLYNGVKKGVFHLYTGDDEVTGKIIHVNGHKLVNFGSCSYFGLETDQRLKQGTIDAVLKYGTQLSASRAYISCGLYEQLEAKFNQLFGAHVVIAPSTTLAHLSSMPVIIGDNDAIILDQQVHASVQSAVQLTKLRGVRVEVIRHSNLEILENLIKELRKSHGKIWYMTDGVYSMYGDFPPYTEIEALMKKYDQLHLYVDDAHGMSWAGVNGRGYTLSQIPLNPKMIVATSLAKCFGTGGGVLICPDQETARKIRTCGSTLLYSGPIQPPMLGASLASADIHLSPEILTMQMALQKRIEYTNNLIKEYDLPTVHGSSSPVFFICLGMPSVGYNIGKKLMNEGLYVNLGIFPALPVKKTGVRFTTTLHQSDQDVKKLIQAIHYHLPYALKEEGQTRSEVHRVFELPEYKESKQILDQTSNGFTIHHKTRIEEVDKEDWDKLFKNKGSFSWDQILFLEKTFTNNPLPEHNWSFHYYIIKDRHNVTKLATFFTCALCKDDIFSPSKVSIQIEKEREKDPHLLVSRCFMMGSILSIGQHLYYDKNYPAWSSLLTMLLNKVCIDQETEKATTLSLRDFDEDDVQLNQFMLDKGFMKVFIPDTHEATIQHFEKKEDFLKDLKAEYRYYLNKKVLSFEKCFDVQITNKLNPDQIKQCRKLFENVGSKKREINVFGLPDCFFERIDNLAQMEFILLKIKPEYEGDPDKIIGFALSHKSENAYHFMVTGMDYDYVEKYHLYPQILWQIVLRANQLQKKNINFGLTASQNKRKFGFAPKSQVIYLQVNDNYNMEVIGLKSVLYDSHNSGSNSNVA